MVRSPICSLDCHPTLPFLHFLVDSEDKSEGTMRHISFIIGQNNISTTSALSTILTMLDDNNTNYVGWHFCAHENVLLPESLLQSSMPSKFNSHDQTISSLQTILTLKAIDMRPTFDPSAPSLGSTAHMF